MVVEATSADVSSKAVPTTTVEAAASSSSGGLTTTSSASSSSAGRMRPVQHQRYFLQNRIRALVSRDKRRFQAQGFDLDLSYITPRLIAMGFPAVNHEAAYRNSADDVELFLETFHTHEGKACYRLYNLCAERTYPEHRFGGHFVRFPFEDHNPPALGMLYFFCLDVDDLLNSDDRAVALVHCKAGKGRTGLAIAAYLLWSGDWKSPSDSMQFYGFARTSNCKGVTIPSQRRFVAYFHQTLLNAAAEDGTKPQATDEPPHSRRQTTTRNNVGGTPHQPTQPPSDPPRMMRSVSSSAVLPPPQGVLTTTTTAGDAQEPASPPSDDDDDEADDDYDDDSTAAGSDADAERIIALDDTHDVDLDDLDDDGASVDSCVVIKRGDARREAAAEPASPPESVEPPAAAEARSKQHGGDQGRVERRQAGGPAAAVADFEAVRAVSPVVRRSKRRLLNDEWNRMNRIRARARRGALPPPKLLAVTSLVVHHARPTRGHFFEPCFKLLCQDFEYKSSHLFDPAPPRGKAPAPRLVFELPPAVLVVDEVCVVFHTKRAFGGKEKAFKFWFHTAFVQDNRLLLTKPELDGACKDKKHAKFDAHFAVELTFSTDHPLSSPASAAA